MYSPLFFNDPATTEISPLSLHDALPICNNPLVSLACAHPAKFGEAIEIATGLKPNFPEKIKNVFDKEENRMNYIRDAFKTLTRREENVLRLYFGIDAQRRFTLQEIGWDFDITQDSVKRIKNKGIRKIKHPTRSRLLTSHIDKDLIERCKIKNWNNFKLMCEWMEQLLYPPREIVEKWVII